MSIASKQVDKKANKTPDKIKVSGVILVDKPQGMTSQQVVSKVKYLFKSPMHDSKKAGHTGTLDPMATGLLPICLGEATKFSHYQLDADKSYQATILLGSQTDTGDADGQIIEQASIPEFDEDLLASIAQQFLGAQQQIPPMYSALKKDGKKLYEYARAGIEVDRPPRDIMIKAIDLNVIDDQQIRLTVTCTKGTYVRVLAEDIAKGLGTLGHLTALRRTQVGKFSIDKSIVLSSLKEHDLEERQSWLLPIDACINIDAELMLTEEQCARVHMGQRLNVFDELNGKLRDYISNNVSYQLTNDNAVSTNDTDLEIDKEGDADLESSQPVAHEIPVDIRLLNEQGEFIGLGAVSLNGRLQPKKLIQR
ncbi:tRNA pseudouridine(55) synthase TruB [Psychrobacter sp. PP-21]|uniref:tRNA pseudouridine(55) synthase TruB n=1 Tax=Psychrobacter sp. PP-21 TaxID=2957503 RepID=UPI0029A29620|nr:tRNA pseudouridine(55) synthase TruB [Psychrobacter sp. PP-21]MDX2373382.1 tRNA pseudouridine(55) synthase TruB [Psychrobacter sp. PP-21]